ncbi:MAG TPA: transglutaminase domain-containing protein [Microcoleaceae cyanobacterium]|jgi:hypothetical protein
MNMPPGLLGAALLFWGWQTGWWVMAIPSAAILEAARLTTARWELSTIDVRRIFNLCIGLFFLILIYLFLTDRSIYVIYTFLQWLPVIFLPLLIAQTYSSEARIDLRSLFLLLSQISPNPSAHWWVNLNYPYLALCILAASAANHRDSSFYAGLVVLVAVALWQGRSRRTPAIVWLCLLALAASLGFVGQIGLHRLHQAVEQQVVAWLGMVPETNPSQKQTNLGDIGLLKRSNQILFRVASPNQQTFPLLLRESAYNKYQSATWIATEAKFTPLTSSNGITWTFNPTLTSPSLQTITIATQLQDGQDLLTLPNGSAQLDQLPVAKLETNQYGTVKVTSRSTPVTYQIQFDQKSAWEHSPSADDLQIPAAERSAIATIVQQLQLQGQPPETVLKQVNQFFLSQFTYSLALTGQGTHPTPLAAFLLEQRSGHCEYFATATTLLLRAVGIPARYATGYSVHEFSALEQQHIVRERNAHAWVMVYINGRWQPFDTTPPTWAALEDATASPTQFLSDWWAFSSFKLMTGWQQLSQMQGIDYGWFLLPAIVVLGWRLRQMKPVRRILSPAPATIVMPELPKPGRDSDFYAIEQALAQAGFPRHATESLQQWSDRLNGELSPAEWAALNTILKLHYRYRFDPNGMTAIERDQLTTFSQSWLAEYQASRGDRAIS